MSLEDLECHQPPLGNLLSTVTTQSMPLRARIKEFLSVKKRNRRVSRETSTSKSGTTTPHTVDDNATPAHATGAAETQLAGSIPVDPEVLEQPTVERPDKVEPEAWSLPHTHDAADGDANKTLMAIDAAIEVTLILKEASEASSVLIPLKVASAAIFKILQTARDKLTFDTDYRSLVGILDAHCRFIEAERRDLQAREREHLRSPPTEGFLTALKAYVENLDTTRKQMELWNPTRKELAIKYEMVQQSEVLKGLEDGLTNSFSTFMRHVHRSILILASNTINKVADMRLAHLTREAINARGDRVKPLTPGTRLSLIERLSAWGRSHDTEDQVFWLHDKAGTGKSSLVAHMAKHWQNEGVLAARFFFDRNGGREFRSLGRLCVTLAKELAENQPLARTMYLEMMEKQSVTDSRAFSDMFRLLVIPVAAQLSARQPKPLIFVIDALDECFEEEIEFLTSAILNALPISKGLRFLLTSRPIDEISARLDGIVGVGGNGVVLLDVKHGDAERDHDTGIYVRHRLKDFSVADQTTVIECAKGVFLWASLACDTLLRTVTPSRVLNKFQNNATNQTLQTLYEAALESALPPDPSSQDMKLLHAVLQGVTLTYSPVSIFAIQSFFPSYENQKVANEEYVEFFVKKLGSIMRDGTRYLPIYILHPTFREFIESQKNGALFYISPPDGHYAIAIACLAWLTKGLTPNVLELDDGKSPLTTRLDIMFEAPARLSLDLEAPLRYAVAFWATHASLAIGEDDQIQQLAVQFFASKFLVWVEWSSAIQELPECIDSLRRLQSAIAVQEPSKVNGLIDKWCTDATRFLLRNNYMIQKCGLQAWMSALTFYPKRSLIYQTYSQKALRPLPQILTDNVDSFDNSRVLWDSTTAIFNIDFSPDGKRILAHGQRAGVRMWNAQTFKLISSLKDRHTGSVESIAFSSDGSLIATGAGDSLICLWDGYTGVFKEKLPRRHKSSVLHVAFALSDSVVVALDQDHQILIWSVPRTDQTHHRARALQDPPHPAEISSMAISPDQKFLATFSADKTVKLWNIETGMAVGGPMLGSDRLSYGVFSRDGTKIIAGYRDGIAELWDAATQKSIRSFISPTLDVNSRIKEVCAIAVFPKGNIIAVGGTDLVFWNMDTGELLCSVEKEEISCLSLNQSGDRLIAGSWKLHVTVWEVRLNEAGDTPGLTIKGTVFKGHTGWINAVASSPSGTLIASGCQDGALRIWDMELLEGSDVDESMKRPHQKVTDIAVSHDGTRVISVGENLNFQMWDFTTGEKVGRPFQSPEGDVSQVMFSFNRDLWMSSHLEGNVCVWRYQSDEVAPTATVIQCDQASIDWIAFAEDKPYMAIASRSKSVRVWELITHTCVAQYDYTYVPRIVAISKDGENLAVVLLHIENSNRYLRSHPVIGGSKLEEGDTWKTKDSIECVVFSPDGKTIVVAEQGRLKLFAVEDPTHYYASFEQSLYATSRAPHEWDPVFSIDGRYLFYWKWAFNLESLSRETRSNPTKLKPAKAEELPHNPKSPLYISRRLGHIRSTHWDESLLVMPPDVRIRPWKAYENMIALGSLDGRVFIIRFPEEFM